MRISDPKMQAWARIGAQIRLRELEAELLAIFRVFPQLRLDPAPEPKRQRTSPESAPKVERTRRTMSAAARKKISEAQKQRWATQKAGKAERQ